MGVALLLFDGAEPWMADYLPFVLPAVLTSLLVVAAVVTALFAPPGRPGPGRVGSAVGLAAVGIAAILVLGWWRLVVSVPEPEWTLIGGLVLAGLVLGCGLLAGVVPSPRGGWRLPGLIGLVGVATPVALVGAAFPAFLVVLGILALTGNVNSNGPFGLDESALPLTMYGVFAGSTLAVLALLPRALSTLPSAAHRSDPKPVQPPARSAPVAVPGVPEILEWPPPSALPTSPHQSRPSPSSAGSLG